MNKFFVFILKNKTKQNLIVFYIPCFEGKHAHYTSFILHTSKSTIQNLQNVFGAFPDFTQECCNNGLLRKNLRFHFLFSSKRNETETQSYERNLITNKTKLVLNSWKVHYLNLDHSYYSLI